MAQYCRYCTWFVCGNGNYCEARDIEPSDGYATKPNKCKHFDLNPIDAYGINPNEYKPKKQKKDDGQQLKMEF